MSKSLDKIDISKVLIAPLYKKTYQHYDFIGDEVYRNIIYNYVHEWGAIYPKHEDEYYIEEILYKEYLAKLLGISSTNTHIDFNGISRIFYNLSNNLSEIKSFSKNKVVTDEYLVNLDQAKPLIEILQSSKYKYDIKYMKYKELLYLIEPIIQMQNYVGTSDNNYANIKYDEKRLITAHVYAQGKTFENHIFEEHKFYAIDINSGMPVSYVFINDDIPYILKNEIKKYKTEEYKSLIKRLFKK